MMETLIVLLMVMASAIGLAMETLMVQLWVSIGDGDGAIELLMVVTSAIGLVMETVMVPLG